MTRIDYKAMIESLEQIQSQIDPADHSDPNDIDSPALIDVRLCIDFDNNEPNWIIRFGLSDYDQRHSELCGAESLGITKRDIERALESMIDQCLDQMSERGES